MDPSELVAELARRRVVPVVSVRDAADAPGLGRALLAGGLPLAEVTFRTDAAADAIAALREETPGVLVGAGTVLTPGTVAAAAGAGAAFVVTPGFNPAVVDACLDRGLPVVPGVATPTEVEMALARGLSVLKFFPAEASGGLAMLTALSGPYASVRFMPTGGVTPANLPDYLRHPAVLACGGTWIATADDISQHRLERITAAAATAVVISDAAGPARPPAPAAETH